MASISEHALLASVVDPNKLDNPNPQVKPQRSPHKLAATHTLHDRVFDVIRDIRDPEHPHSLEQLSVVDHSAVAIVPPPEDTPGYGTITVTFTPTVPHCSLAALIGLSIHAKMRQSPLLRPPGEHYYKLHVACAAGTHTNAHDITRQLADKERVAAAFENPRIMAMLRECIDNLPP